TLAKLKITLEETILQKNAEIEETIAKFDAIVAEKDGLLDDSRTKISNLSQNLAATKESELNFSFKLNDTVQEFESFRRHHVAKLSDHEQVIQAHVSATELLKQQFNTTLSQKNAAIAALDDQSRTLQQTETNVENLKSTLTETHQTLEHTKKVSEDEVVQKNFEIKELEVKIQDTISTKDTAIAVLHKQVDELGHNLEQSRDSEYSLTIDTK
ncbi:hypothetical protein HK100_000879, partial [Physocladia obscura]